MTRIFVTGATGYIGGDALHAIVAAHPEYDITALVRNSEKGARVAKEYAKIRLVYGDLGSEEVLEREARDADIVLNFADADHEAGARALVKGLAAHEPSKPGFLIHTSGTGMLMLQDIREKTYGTGFRDKVYDDLEGVNEVTSFPDDAPHRAVDKIVLAAGAEFADRVKTAIVSPPTIYGIGNGPDNKRSIQLPELCRASLQRGFVGKVDTGNTYWGNVHVHDLSALYLKLVEEAAAGGSKAEWPDKPAVWGPEGYYFCENGEHVWGEVSQWLADEGKKQGVFESNEVKSISGEEAAQWTESGMLLWGGNSRSRAQRARRVLGWEAKNPSLKDEVAATLQSEVQRLNLKPGHAEVAAGN